MVSNLATLSPSLQAIAMARINAPDASLQELGQMLDPPIGKSGVNHRMRRLMEIIHQMEAKAEEILESIEVLEE